MNQAFKEEFLKIAKDDKLFDADTKKLLLTGFGAGATSAAILSPVNIVKTVMETDAPGTGKNFAETAVNLYRRGGVGRFYKGLLPTVGKLGAGTAIVFGANQVYKEMLDKKFPSK